MSQMEQEPAEAPPWTLGWRIQRALSWAGVSVQEMADDLEVSRGTVSRWCNDRNRPRPAEVKQIALKTRVPLAWLRFGEEWAARDSNSEPMDSSPDGVSTAELKTEFLRNIGLSGVTPARTGRPRHRVGVA